MRSVMTHQFSKVPRASIERSSFDRSHGHKTTFDAGYLIPVYCDEALPGDTFNLSMTAFARLATPIKPVMDNMFLESFFFAVPLRLIWNDFQKFCGEQEDPGDSTDFRVPKINWNPAHQVTGDLYDYLGLPVLAAAPGFYTTSALWTRAYNLIWNQWFRDENLQDSVVVDKGAGPDDNGNYLLLRRGKRHDYFTSCLPWPQKGDDVTLPLGSTAEVVLKDPMVLAEVPTILEYSTKGPVGADTGLITRGTNGRLSVDGGALDMAIDPNGSLLADLSNATASTINSIRQAFQLQHLLERDARGGTRYTEIIKSHFGVTSPDARLQRPEFLGGGSTPVQIHPVAQTSASGGGAFQGNLAAFGTAVATRGHGFVKSFTEHCVLIGLVCVRADLNYQQGLPRMFSRDTRYDFYWPALAHLGEQAVLNKEIYFQGTADDEEVFGYQERFAEYRYKQSLVTGLFRSQVAGSLDVWHLAEEFGALPALDATFIQENPPIDRVIAVPSEPHFIFDSFFNLKCARPMPVYSVPGLIDHF